MTDRKKIVFKIEGTEKASGHLELSVFVGKIRQFLDFLKISAKDSGADDTVFQVVKLSHSSPVTIECEPIGKNAAVAFFDSVRKNLNLEETHNLSDPALSSMEKLADFNPQKIAWAEIQVIGDDIKDKHVYQLDDRFRKTLRAARGNEEAEIQVIGDDIKDKHVYQLKDKHFDQLDDHFRKTLRAARSNEEKVISTIDGKLEQINIHNHANTFRIYPALSHLPSVACKFPDHLLDVVQNALGKFVSVWGECSYRPSAAFPHKIDVREMKILPPSKDLPTLSDLRGIAPGATGDKSSEQFVRELRDKWDDRVR